MYRHGDVLLKSVDELPTGAVKVDGVTLAYGERTGHSHRLAEPKSAELFRTLDGLLFVKVIDDTATLIHEEHKAIALPHGIYQVWQQREYSPEAIRTITD